MMMTDSSEQSQRASCEPLTAVEREDKAFLPRDAIYASAVLAMGLCLSQVGVLLKRLNVGSHKQHRTIPQGL